MNNEEQQGKLCLGLHNGHVHDEYECMMVMSGSSRTQHEGLLVAVLVL